MSGSANIWVVIPSALVALAGVLFGWFSSRRKSEIDESTLILGKWKELVDTHQIDIKTIKEEFAIYRRTTNEELEALRTRLRHAEQEVLELRTENAQLKRLIAQNSQSTAAVIGDMKERRAVRDRKMDDEIKRLDQAGDNSVPKGNGGD